MISKENFCKLINAVKSVEDDIQEINKVLPGLAEDAMDITGNLATTIVDVLDEEMALPKMDNIGSTISWWIWECDYGTNHPDISWKDRKTNITTRVHLDTVEKLYDYLVKYEAGVEYYVDEACK